MTTRYAVGKGLLEKKTQQGEAGVGKVGANNKAGAVKGSLQAEDWGVEEVMVGRQKGLRCGFCAGRGKHRGGIRVGKGGGRKAVIPTRECSRCKLLVCMHLSHYAPGTIQVRCPKH